MHNTTIKYIAIKLYSFKFSLVLCYLTSEKQKRSAASDFYPVEAVSIWTCDLLKLVSPLNTEEANNAAASAVMFLRATNVFFFICK